MNRHEIEKIFDFYVNIISTDDSYWAKINELPLIEQQQELKDAVIKCNVLKDDVKQILNCIENFETNLLARDKETKTKIQMVVNDYIVRNTKLPATHSQYGCDDKDPINFGTCERCTALVLHKNVQMQMAIDML